ncbi:MAG: hypothetical protein ACYDEE_13540 [Ignavibacteriaceae bacterium]
MSEFNLPAKLDHIQPEQNQNNGYVDQIKNTISNCTSDISKVSSISASIKAQSGWEGYWKKGDNIRTLGGNFVLLSSVQQRTLDMLVLLIGAAGRMKTDYNVILESIEELSKSHSGSVDVLEYLVKIKNTVNEIKRRDELLDSLITFSNELRDNIEELDTNFKKEIKSILLSSKELQDKNKELVEGLSSTKIIIEEEQKYNSDKFTELNKDIDLKHKNVLDAIKYLENGFKLKMELNSADQLKIYLDCEKSLKQNISDAVVNQMKINEDIFSNIKKYSLLATIFIIVLALSILAVVIFK